MRLRIQETSPGENVPDELCGSCYKSIVQTVSRGAKLRAEQVNREQNKLIMWKTRVTLVKQGRNAMARKSYSDAAINFEKYLRVLEVVFDKKSGELTPETFKDSARTKEITVVASVLWDLIRIYDMTPRYGDRQKKAAVKLVSFLQYSTVQAEIIRKARQFEGVAKNKGVIKDFIKSSDKKGGKCFIATATYGSSEVFEVRILRSFRDRILVKSFAGKLFTRCYYIISPLFAEGVERSLPMQKLLKSFFGSFAPWLDRRFDLQTPKDL